MSDTVQVAQLPVLRLKRNEDRRLHAGHLWIFSNEVDTQQTPLVNSRPAICAGAMHNDRAWVGLRHPQSLTRAARLP